MTLDLAGPASRTARVFLSYKRNVEPDGALARHVVDALTGAGHRVFIDQRLTVGQAWAEEIEKQVRKSDFLIVFLTAESSRSEMVRGEIEIARHHAAVGGAPGILPVRVNFDGPLPYPLNAYLDRIQYATWSTEADTPRLLRELELALSGHSTGDLTPMRAPAGAGTHLPPPYAAPLPVPGGTLDVDDPWYLARATDTTALAHIRQPGQTLTIKGPRQMGKSSLLMRTVKEGMEAGKSVTLLDFQLVDEYSKAHADVFFRRFASWVVDQLNLPDSVEKFWNAAYASPQNCTRYVEQQILEKVDGPVIVAIDETDAIFQTSFSQDFFSMLRSWHNKRADPIRRGWKKLDIILSTSTEPQFFIDRPHESPFNVGVTLRVEDFELDQVAELNARHPRPLGAADVDRLYRLVRGHPYLTRKALYLCAGTTPTCSVDDLFARAQDDGGPFGDHLRDYLLRLQRKQDLIPLLRQVIDGRTLSDELAIYRLQALGLVRREGHKVTPRCDLYGAYFRERLRADGDAFQFVAGGAVQAGGGVYLERDADRELLRHCLDGDFTYILTSRQMGKSSLMYRAAERLGEAGARPVIIDLTELGAQTTADQWYKGFLLLIQEQLGLQENASAWWDAHAEHAYAHRLIRYLREVALVERPERLVLFVDEIDTTLRLDFCDDFFAAIRFLYQTRAMEPELQRISFVLIGVATPNDLIKDASRTPFNIGHRIELTDFSRQEAAVLASHLAMPTEVSSDLIYWILRWTGGHPYLTLRVLRSLAENPPPAWTADAVDGRLYELFLGTAGESDTNLQFVRDMLTKKADNREAVLATYDAIRGGARVPDREHDQITSWLKLSGVVRRDGDLLKVRNPIYEKVFDQNWTKVHRRLNINWRRRLAQAAAALAVIAVFLPAALAVYAFQQRNNANEQRQQAVLERAEAMRQRDDASRQLLLTQDSLKAAQGAIEQLKRFDPQAAAALTNELQTTRATADKEVAALRTEREKLQADRDAARTQLQKLTQDNTRLTQENASLRRNPSGAQQTAQVRTVAVPNLVGRQSGETERLLGSAGLTLKTQVVDSDQTRGTVIDQDPNPGVQVASGSAVAVSMASGPPPALTRGAQDETQQLLRVLQRYKNAYESLDAKAVAAVYPSVNVASLQGAFDQFSKMSYELLVHVDGVTIDGSTATVTATETMRPTSKSVRAQPTTTTSVFTLRRSGTSWTIYGVSSNRR